MHCMQGGKVKGGQMGITYDSKFKSSFSEKICQWKFWYEIAYLNSSIKKATDFLNFELLYIRIT